MENACKTGDLLTVKKFLNDSEFILTPTTIQKTPELIAATKGHWDIVELFTRMIGSIQIF